jgi:hypothetical protein
MYKTLLYLLALSATISFSQIASAQTSLSDTTSIDLGRLQLKKEFTQSITIKGEDLERMPFTSLNEAINSWTYGLFTNLGTFTYVIDGNLLNDVNAYSIHDIKEITLVQNALVQINGADRQQQLVLITTRKGSGGKQGLTVSGQSFQTNRQKSEGQESNNTFFHQYNVAAWKNWNKVQIGVSVNYLRDKTPTLKNITSINYKLDRYRITAWMNAQLGSNNELYVQLNTAPANGNGDAITSNSKSEFDQENFSFNPIIGLRSRFLKGFSNDISVAYMTKKDESQIDQAIFLAPPTINLLSNESEAKTEVVLIRENLRYSATVNNWRIEPAINLTFRYRKSKVTTSSMQQSGVGGPILGGPNPPSYTFSETKLEGRLYLLTPSLSLSYKSIFNLQGGLLANISSTNGKKINRVFPFVSTTINVLPPTGAQATSLQVFGSYAKTDYFGDGASTIEQLNTGGPISSPIGPTTQFPDSSYSNWQAGTRIGFLHNRLSVGYNFEKRDYTQAVVIQAPFGSGWLNVINYPEFRSTSHHINVNAAILQTTNLQWRTGLTVSHVKTTMIFPANSTFPNVKGDDANSKAWTGGWVNRLTYGRFSAGLDLLYNFNKDQQLFTSQETKVNAITVQNVYVGYRFNIKGIEGLELYAATRNLAQHYNSQYWLGGGQQYYGLGFKADL